MAGNPKMTTCRNCGAPIAVKAGRCQACGAKNRKPFYKRWWCIFLLIIIIFGVYNTISRKLEEKEEKTSEYRWPDSELANMIPQPDSPYGRISSESERSFLIDIYDVSEKQFEDYVDQCKEYGFSVDYSKMTNYYSANNEAGYSLRISYYDEDKEMGISLYVPSDQEDTPKSEDNEESSQSGNQDGGQTGKSESENGEIKQEEPSADTEDPQPSDEDKSGELVDGMRPEFREAMDSYEAFYDEYCEFMKEYSKNPTDMTLLKKYTDFLTKTQEMEEKFEAWDDNELNDAELKYYTEVHQRIMQKLLEISTEE